MRVLLDTNILIHREAQVVVRQDIGTLFNWLDRLGYQKVVHPVSIEEIKRHDDERVRRSFAAKLASYNALKAIAALAPEIVTLTSPIDVTDNDRNDTRLLNELFLGRVDLLITEDRGLLRKSRALGIDHKTFTIDSFLEKAVAENPELVDYRVLSVRRTLIGNIDVSLPFFDSFRSDYPGFNQWFARKSDEPAYVCFQAGNLVAFLYLKVEDQREPYPDIVPQFSPKRRLKIGTLKVDLNGLKLGERFLKIVFDNAIAQRVDEIYVTIFDNSAERERLTKLLEDFGFTRHGHKQNSQNPELVLTRGMRPAFNPSDPKISFPFVSKRARVFLVPIYPEYHTDLLPDSILRTESPDDFVEHEPHRNALRKVYVSRSIFRDLVPGDVIVFYRTGGFHKSVVTTLGIVERIHRDIASEEQFIDPCRKRSVFSDKELRDQWRYRRYPAPFLVEFLYSYAFPKRPNLAALIANGVIKDVGSAPRGFERITNEQFETIIRLSESDTRIIVD